jgi:hypothetical protein
MKKLLGILSVALVMTACNNAADADGEVKDSVLETIDSTADARIDSVKEATDSLETKVEKTFEKTDSANKAIADSADRNN